MKTLHLNLHRKWFDMVLSGEKKEEYRDITKYWARRFCYRIPTPTGYLSCINQILNKDMEGCERWVAKGIPMFKEFDTITFSNGYAKDRDQFVIELKYISIRKGLPEWGAEKDKVYFVLHLGEIINTFS